MFNISQYLKRFTHITPPDDAVRKTAVHTIENTYKITLSLSEVSVQNNILYIKTSPGIKSKIFIHKKTIIKEISQQVGEGVVFDIR